MKFKRNLTYEDFKKYFRGLILNKERHAFEKQLMQDEFESEAYDGLSQLSAQEMESDIEALKQQVSSRSKKRFIGSWWQMAAGIAILIGVGATVLIMNNRLSNTSFEQPVAKSDEKTNITPVEKEELPIKSESTEKKEVDIEIQPELTQTEKSETPQAIAETINIVDDTEDIEEELLKFEMAEPIAAIVDSKALVQELEHITIDNNVVIESVEEEAAQPARAVVDALQGKVAGVEISNSRKLAKSEIAQPDSDNVLKIRGMVSSSEDGQPLPGVSLIIDGTQVGDISDIDGNFYIEVKDDEDLKKLVAAFVGMETKEILLRTDTNIMVTLDPDVLALDEVVVTAYGVQKEKQNNAYSSQEITFDQSPTENRLAAQPRDSRNIIQYKKNITGQINLDELRDFPGTNKIKVELTINNQGNIRNIEFIDYPDSIFVDILKPLIENGEKWEPAKLNDIPIESKVKLTFRIKIGN